VTFDGVASFHGGAGATRRGARARQLLTWLVAARVSRVGDFPFYQKVVDRLRRVANKETGACARVNLVDGLDARFWGGEVPHGSSFSITDFIHILMYL